MAQGNVGQSSGHQYTTNDTTLKYRTTNSGNPLQHDSVDANFDILRKAVNGLVSDISGVAGKTVLTDVPAGAVFTDTAYNHPNHSGDVTSVGDGATTIANGAVTEAKIGPGAVTNTKIATGAVTTDELSPNAVTSNNIAPGTLSASVLDPTTINNLQPQMKANSATMLDHRGVTRTLDDTGTIYCMVNQSGSTTEDGPNTMLLASSAFDPSTDILTASGHGFLYSGNKVVFQPGTANSVAPGGITYGTPYYIVPHSGLNELKLAPTVADAAAANGARVNITSAGNGTHLMSREPIIAFDAQDWITTSGTATYCPVVNFQFKTVAQAYRWFVRYSGSSNMGILCSDANSVNCMWHDSTAGDIQDEFWIGHGTNFEMLNNLIIRGYLGSFPYDSSQGDLYNNKTYKSIIAKRDPVGHPALYRSRILVNLQNGDRATPIWFRIFGSVKISNVAWDYKIPAGTTFNLTSMMRCAAGRFQFYGNAWTVHSAESTSPAQHGTCTGDMRALSSMEGAALYVIAGFHAFYGLKSYGAALSVGGGAQIFFGTPQPIYTIASWADGVNNGLINNFHRLQAAAVSAAQGVPTLQNNKTWVDTTTNATPVNNDPSFATNVDWTTAMGVGE